MSAPGSVSDSRPRRFPEHDPRDRSRSPRFQPARAGDVRDSLASLDRISRVLGYQPLVPFEEGLRRTVAAGDVNRLAELEGQSYDPAGCVHRDRQPSLCSSSRSADFSSEPW